MHHETPEHIAHGVAGEQLAESFLLQQGLETLERNWRCKLGEIDLIMNSGGELVFVEVRLRKQTTYGTGSETVQWQKQRKLTRTASLYIQKHDLFHKVARFDVVSITVLPNGEYNIEHIPHAFST